MTPVTVFHRSNSSTSVPVAALRLSCIALAVSLAGCSTVENALSGDKVDYRSATKTTSLEVPPDLTQLARDPRFQPPGGTVSAAAFQSAAPAAISTGVSSSGAASVSPQSNALRLERSGTQRWLVTPQSPEQVWPQLQAFWKERGLTLVVDQADVGVMETEWAENRAKLPNDFIRNTLGRVLESLYSTGERDKFRTRVERTASGSEIYISHRGMIETYTSQQKDSTSWQPRPADAELEAEFLQRLMVKLGAKEDQAKSALVAGASQPARARELPGQSAASLQVDETFDRAWRRVGLALDRSGFTVEDRDRAQGVYFVRYVDPKMAGKEEPGFFSRIFSFGNDAAAPTGPTKYRVAVKVDGERSIVSVLNAQGGPENGEAGKRIVALLVEDLK